jgi:FixJ family two-component response regulator
MGSGDSVPKIAVIDDDDGVQRSLDSLLQSAGYRCALYSSAEAFLDECALHPPDCAIVDFHLPGLNGLELQRRVNEKGHSIPIIMISAHDDQVRAKAIEQGAVAFLAKPFDGETLLAVIRSALQFGF